MNRRLTALLLLYAAWLAISLPSLLTYPAPHSDEAWIGSTGVSVLRSGENEVIIFGDTTGIYRSQDVWHLYAVILAGWFRVVGIGLLQARVLSLVACGITAYLLYRMASEKISTVAGLLAAALYLFSLRVLYTSHFVRPDALVQLWGILTWVVYLSIRERPSPVRAAFLGILCVVGIDLFPITLYFGITAGVGTLCLGIQKRDRKLIAWLLAGAVLGAGYIVAARLLPDPIASIREMQSVTNLYSQPDALPFLHKNFLAYLQEDLYGTVFLRGLWQHNRLAPLETILWSAGLILALTRRNFFDRFLIIAGLVLWVGFLIPFKGLSHLTDFAPWISLLIANMADWIGRTVAERWDSARFPIKRGKGFVIMLVATPLLGSSILAQLLLIERSSPIQYPTTAATISQALPPGARILGEGVWWWWLPAEHYISDDYVSFVQRADPTVDPLAIVTRVMAEQRLNVILIDDYFSSYDFTSQLDLQDAVTRYAVKHCSLHATVPFMGYGVEHNGPARNTVRVYRCP